VGAEKGILPIFQEFFFDRIILADGPLWHENKGDETN
jgi:hypothetical protein